MPVSILHGIKNTLTNLKCETYYSRCRTDQRRSTLFEGNVEKAEELSKSFLMFT